MHFHPQSNGHTVKMRCIFPSADWGYNICTSQPCDRSEDLWPVKAPCRASTDVLHQTSGDPYSLAPAFARAESNFEFVFTPAAIAAARAGAMQRKEKGDT